jgi:hypothetical protein
VIKSVKKLVQARMLDRIFANANTLEQILEATTEAGEPQMARAIQLASERALELGLYPQFADALIARWETYKTNVKVADVVLRAVLRSGKRTATKDLVRAGGFDGATGWQERIDVLCPGEFDRGPVKE